jgi:hypothetical protein
MVNLVSRQELEARLLQPLDHLGLLLAIESKRGLERRKQTLKDRCVQASIIRRWRRLHNEHRPLNGRLVEEECAS